MADITWGASGDRRNVKFELLSWIANGMIKSRILTLCYLHPEIAIALSNFTMPEITNYFVAIVAAEKEASYQLFNGGHVQDPKAKVGVIM